MRYDLAFFLCCCKSFFGSDPNQEDFYSLLELERDASADDVKRAYKKKSLQMHPDKLAQRGEAVTEENQARFTRMKEAYEVLSDAHKRETYDAIGERGMKLLEEPFSLDPQELAHNFAKSSLLDRSKIFAIFVVIFVTLFMLPFLICLQMDGALAGATWMAMLTPLWIWNILILFYHTRVIMMGPMQRPDHVPVEEWIDPLPMKKRVFSLIRFVLLVIVEVFVALKLDGALSWSWFVIFAPLFLWEATTIYKKAPLARMRIVTVDDLEIALGKPFMEFTPAEKELIGKKYSVVPSTSSPEFDAAQKLKLRARHDLVKSAFRIAFCILLLVQLEGWVDWNWWLIFLPFWFMTALFCYANYASFVEVQQAAAEKDPNLFGKSDGADTLYGAVGKDGTPPLSEEEREELKAQVMASSSRLCSKCCSQGFILVMVMLLVAKLQGAAYSAVWIISPLLFVAGSILCCLGCAIFGITEVNTEGVEFDTVMDSDVEAPLSSSSYAPPPVVSSISTPQKEQSPPTVQTPTVAAPEMTSTTALPTLPIPRSSIHPTSTASYDLD